MIFVQIFETDYNISDTVNNSLLIYKHIVIPGQLEIPTEKNGHLQQSMEMIPLISKSDAKDSVITLDYVSNFKLLNFKK